jgi:AraC-like DNA-binding protein
MAISESLPLAGYQTVLSKDIDEARERVARLYCPHGLTFAGASRSLALRHHHAKLATTSVNYMDYGGDLLIEPGFLDRFFLFMAPLAGMVQINPESPREAGAGTGGAVIANPTDYTRIRWSEDCRQVVLTIDRAAVERCLSTLLGRTLREPVLFVGEMDRTAERAASLWRAINFLIGELDAAGSNLLDKAPASYFENTMVAMFLTGWPNNYSDALAGADNRVAPRHVRRVEAYIEANAHLPVTLETLVEIGGVSATALFEGFRRFRQTTPMAALRDHRMRRAHAEFEKAGVGDSVTSIATRWGFYHLGRFAADYKKRYGETPSETLSRAVAR